jgi:hypothetical protein
VSQIATFEALADVGQKIDIAIIAKMIIEYKTFLILGSPC